MAKFKKPLLFAVCLLPFAAAAGIFLGFYQLDICSDDVIAEMIAVYGSTNMMVAISTVQTVIYALVFGFFGYILSDKIGLWKPIGFEKKKIAVTLAVSIGGGILFSLDHWTFGNIIDGIQSGNEAGLTVAGVLASILYGGIIEEVMLRLFFMSLITLIIWKVFYRKLDRENIPTGVFAAANIIAALLFAAGHLPATLTIFGQLTPLIVFRCFLLNGGFGLIFGWLYRKHGIVYAMTSHALFHIVSKLIWIVFIIL